MNPSLFRCLVASLTLLAPPALARAEHEFSLAAGTFSYTSFQRPSLPLTTFEVAYQRRLSTEGWGRGVRVGGGLRTGLPFNLTHVPLEAFVQAQLTARLGIWEAAFGPELGVGGFARLFESKLLRPAVSPLEDARLGPVHVAFVAAPLRFHLGPVVVSALELQLGTSAPFLGQAVRMQLGFVRIGVVR